MRALLLCAATEACTRTDHICQLFVRDIARDVRPTHRFGQVRRLLDTKREDINRMPMLLDVSRAFAEVLINYLITEKLDALEVRAEP